MSLVLLGPDGPYGSGTPGMLGGYRPCFHCLRGEYRAWKAGQ